MLLRDKDRNKLIAIFSEPNYRFEVWAYGSRVNGDAHDASDLDLVLRPYDLKQMPPEIYRSLQEKIQDSTIPIIVELFDWARLPLSFHRNIEARHEVLFSNLTASVHEPGDEYKVKQDPEKE